VVYIAITGSRGVTLYCAVVRAVTVWGGVPKQRVGAQRTVLIRAQRPRHKTISCTGQVTGRYSLNRLPLFSSSISGLMQGVCFVMIFYVLEGVLVRGEA